MPGYAITEPSFSAALSTHTFSPFGKREKDFFSFCFLFLNLQVVKRGV
jgi:hypothetical protein